VKIAVTGGTGFIGQHLIDSLIGQGHEVFLISRHEVLSARAGVTPLTWHGLEQDVSVLEGVDAIVNLAGETINQRWTEEAKGRILASRVVATRRVASIVERLQQKPQVVVNGSGTSDPEQRDENTVTLLADVVREWEKAADEIQGVRVVKLRISVVLSRDGGAFGKMFLPYRMFVGGPVGSGKQWLPWIHIRDMVRLIEFCITNEDVEGVVNATAPDAVTNDQFGRALARAAGRPHWMPVPRAMMRLLFGEMADLLLKGQKIEPVQALQHGFVFEFGTVEQALRDLVGK
jgi:uncharacterized protein